MVGSRSRAVALLVASLMAGACGGKGEEATDATASEESPADGTVPEGADLAEGADALSPEELSELYAVAVPEGMFVVSAAEDPGEGTATFELSYEGEPDVDGYRQAIVDAGWEIEAEGPLASYAWCLSNLADVAREILDRLGFPGGDLVVAYVVLAAGGVEWRIAASRRDCVPRTGLDEQGD